jgi:hypothetical protein
VGGGIDAGSINITDLVLARPDHSGPGGDSAGIFIIRDPVEAIFIEQVQQLRVPDGREVVLTGTLYVDPLLDDSGDVIPIKPGDWASFTDLQGVKVEPQEIVVVKGVMDCSNRLDVVELKIGSAQATGS